MLRKILIDLFCGAGGLSLGFKFAGFDIKLAIDNNKNFLHTYELNNPETICLKGDITQLDFFNIKNKYLRNGKITGIIGGPPCQGFSTVGYRKTSDYRNSLIYFFIKAVKFFKPKFFVMENVPGILTMEGGKVIKKIKLLYNKIGYQCILRILLAADFGVPQLRKRVFFIGTKDKSVYSLNIKKTNQPNSFQKQLFDNNSLPSYLTVRDALSDILEIKPFNSNYAEDSYKEYIKKPQTEYQKYLRKNSAKLYDHFAPNHSKEVIERISHIRQGENHNSLPEKYKLKGGYSNIYGRLDLKKPADTITGNCGCVSAPGRFIHPTQHRAISVREAARLQSFPDNYRFFGNLRDKYREVGNAVPPLMSFAIAKGIITILEN
ncbi:MAG: DNA cytosine methyltransferase [Promethearchaeota archaeon]